MGLEIPNSRCGYSPKNARSARCAGHYGPHVSALASSTLASHQAQVAICVTLAICKRQPERREGARGLATSSALKSTDSESCPCRPSTTAWPPATCTIMVARSDKDITLPKEVLP